MVFDCVELLTFTGSSDSVCQWVDAGIVNIIPSLSITPGNTTIAPSLTNTIRAACIDTTAVPCLEWDSMNSSISVVIEFPVDPIVPEVIVFGPKTIGSCSNLTLDISSSRGSSGRDWLNRPVFSIAGSSAANESNLLHFLNFEYEMYAPSVITSNYLEVGDTYSITVTLCNFFMVCGNGSYLFVVDAEELVPIVSIIAPYQQSIHRKDVLSLTTHAILQRCDGHLAYSTFEYTWLVYPNGYDETIAGGGALTSISTTSNDPGILQVSPHVLLANYFYSIEVSVLDIYTLQTVVSPSVLVFVVPGNVVGVIAGGTQLSMRYLSTLEIDGSESYDEDVAGGASDSNLTYKWTCVQTAPSYSVTCPFSHDSGSTSSSFVLNASDVTNLDTFNALTVSVSLLVTDTLDSTRFSLASVIVATVPTLAPHIDILTSYLQDRVLTTDSLLIAATIETSYDCVTEWSVNETSLQLSSISSTNVSRTITPGGPQRVYLDVYPDALYPRYTYLFSLSCGESSGELTSTTISSIIIATNGPPYLGSFLVSPAIGGDSLTTSFAFVASNWVDQDLPITYSFGYCPPNLDVSGCTFFMPIRGQSEVSYGYSTLPTGLSDNMYNVTCFANVYDSLNAFTTGTVAAQVLPNEALMANTNTSSGSGSGSSDSSISTVNATYVYNILLQQNSISSFSSTSTSEVDAMKQIVSVFSSILNTVNCSIISTSLCSDYNRNNCTTLAHTCGECLNGYIGATGHHNSICTSAVDSVFDTGVEEYFALLNCTTTSDCVYDGKVSMWYECNEDSKKCEIGNKPCQNNCTSATQGTCSYLSETTGLSVSKCALSDSSCTATCLCTTGFAGSDCSLTESHVYHQTQIRDILASNAYTLTVQEAVSESAVTGWISGLSEVSKHTAYLSTNSTTLISQAVLNTMKAASSLGMSHLSLETVLGALSNAAYHSLLQNTDSDTDTDSDSGVVSMVMSTSNRRQLSATTDSKAAVMMDSLSDSLKLFCELVISSLLPEHDAYVSIHSSFRIGVMSIAEADLESPYSTDYIAIINTSIINITTVDNYISVSVPSTPLELLLSPPTVDSEDTSTNSTVLAGISSIVNSTNALFPVSSFDSSNTSTTTLSNGAVTSFGAISVFEITRHSYGTKDSTGFHTNPVAFQASSVVNASSTAIKATLRNAQAISYSPIPSLTKFTTVCVPLLERNFTYQCLSGPDIVHQCTNTSATIDIIESYCAVTLQEPQCSNVIGITGDVDQPQCSLVSYGDWETVCECPLAVITSELELSSSSDVRKLSSTDSVVYNTTYPLVTLTSIEYEVSPISHYIPDATMEPSLLVFGLLGVLALVVLVWFGITFASFGDGGSFRKDKKEDLKVHAAEADNEKLEEAVQNYLTLMIPQVFIPTKDVNVLTTTHPTKLSKFAKIRSELWRYHKYLRIFHIASSKHERNRIFISICYVFSVLIMIMFLVSTIYDISFPKDDDGTCEYNFTEEECLVRYYDDIYPPRHYCTWRQRYINTLYEPVYTCIRAPIMYPRVMVRHTLYTLYLLYILVIYIFIFCVLTHYILY